MCRSSCPEQFRKFTGKHLCQRLWYRCFPVNFAKFLRTSFLTEHLRWLLLDVCVCEHVCVCVCVSVCLRPSTVKVSSLVGWNSRGQISDVVLKTFLSSARSLHRYFSMKHRAFLTSRFILFTH